jgi:CheY-like chemotaxis protein
MAKDRAKVLNQIVRKIPLFMGMSPSQMDILLKVCHAKPFEAGEVICASNTDADEMYILLSGDLAVVTDDGTRVAKLKPVTTVGELGMVTRQKRRATVESLTSGNMLVIRRNAFESMLQSRTEIQARILRNIVDIVGDKITSDNVRMRDHVRVTLKLERQVRELERRAEMAADMLVEETGIGLDQIEGRIDKQELKQRFMRVVVVDDEEGVRHLLRDALTGCETVEVGSGEEALEALGQQPADLVITDIRMDGMDGYELLNKVKEQFPQLPVLAISGVVDGDEMRHYAFDGVMEKPLDIEELRDLVDEVVESRRTNWG